MRLYLMQLIKTISEREMVAVFVAAESKSARFGETTRQIMRDFKISPNIISRLNLNSVTENRARAKVLDEWRGY